MQHFQYKWPIHALIQQFLKNTSEQYRVATRERLEDPGNGSNLVTGITPAAAPPASTVRTNPAVNATLTAQSGPVTKSIPVPKNRSVSKQPVAKKPVAKKPIVKLLVTQTNAATSDFVIKDAPSKGKGKGVDKVILCIYMNNANFVCP
jgi:hypothetical protein